jgi:hypothetical protein
MNLRSFWRRGLATLLALVLLGGGSVAAQPRTTIASVPAFSHLFIIVMENREYPKIIDSPSAPYINRLAQQYGLATNYYAIMHESLLDYLALTGGSTFGLTSSCTSCIIDASNIVDQLEGAGKSWKAYMEDMPSPCFTGNASGLYRKRHNPFIYYKDIQTNPTRCNQILPYTQLATDLKNETTVPNYVWITPNVCNDMHNAIGCATTDQVKNGDTWLAAQVPKILNSSAYQHGGVLFSTGEVGATNAGCCTWAAGGRVATLVISPLGKPAYQSAVAYDHYSLLRTIEDAWGLSQLRNAGCSCTATMTDFFTGP